MHSLGTLDKLNAQAAARAENERAAAVRIEKERAAEALYKAEREAAKQAELPAQ